MVIQEATVVHGRESLTVTIDPGQQRTLSHIQQAVQDKWNISPDHQKLIYRGRELRDPLPETLPGKCKLMLLLNKSYHNSHQPKQAAKVSIKSTDTVETPPQPTKASIPLTFPSSESSIPQDDDSTILIQAMRGKSKYDLRFSEETTVSQVKSRLSNVLGVSSNALRLVIKGKTPDDATSLRTLSKTNTIKCMVLLQEQQHIVMEKEEDFRLLLNELTQLQGNVARTEKQMARNFSSREEMLVQLSTLQDSVQRVHDNLELLHAHLSKQPTRSEALQKAMVDAKDLCSAVTAMLQRHSIN